MFRLHTISKRRRAGWFVAVVVLGAMLPAGCGSSDPFDYARVSGKVTYDDGSLIPAARITVTFLSQAPAVDAKTHPRPGMAEVNTADGTFDIVTSHKYGDGIVHGKHKVHIQAFDEQNQPSRTVPSEYSHPQKTPLEIDSADSPYHFKVKKPQ